MESTDRLLGCHQRNSTPYLFVLLLAMPKAPGLDWTHFFREQKRVGTLNLCLIFMSWCRTNFPMMSPSHMMILLLPWLSERFTRYWYFYCSQVNRSQYECLTSGLQVIILSGPAAVLKLTMLNCPEIERIIHELPLECRDGSSFWCGSQFFSS